MTPLPRPLRSPALALILAAALHTAQVCAADPVFTSPVELLTRAVVEGRAQGTLRGPFAQLLAARFGGTEPVAVSAEVIGDHPRAGCKRLRWTADVRGSVTPASGAGGTAPPVQMQAQLNWCAPGRFWFEEPGR